MIEQQEPVSQLDKNPETQADAKSEVQAELTVPQTVLVDTHTMSVDPLPENYSPLWGRSTKLIVVVIGLLLITFTAYRFQSLITLLVLGSVIAYIINPLIVFVNERTRIARGWVILAVYLLLVAVIVFLSIALGVATFEQASSFINQVPALIDQTASLLESIQSQTEPMVIGPLEINPLQIPWDSITNQVLSLVEPTVSTSGQFITQLATTTVRLVGNLFFVVIISIYLVYEFPKLGGYVGGIANEPGYRYDADRFVKELGRIWSAYLRGQVILGVIIFLAVWLGLSILGVRNALVLGIIAGLLEFVPNIGPIISAGIAMAVAFFQPTNRWDIEGWQFALLVLGLMFLIQQIENNYLVPRIVGRALDLHPILVILGVFMGASLAGVLGAVLAAPLLATIKLLGTYAWRKLFDLPPFPDSEELDEVPA
ncbi:MAG: AI-2E family transporter [Anaerolineales bacterium]|nr:AI-2E family transporter [Anaerolineales bacterium]